MGSEDGAISSPETPISTEETKEEKMTHDPLTLNDNSILNDAAHDFDENLPKTVTLLHGPNGSKLYLVGTAHFSLESQEDVSTVIRAVRPHIVVVELCRARSSVLRLDEKTIQEEVCNMSFTKMREIIKENGFLRGMMNILFLSVSAQLTRDLGMAPGGEFRRAFQEVKELPGCLLHYGDRPIHITLSRALNVLSWWQRIYLASSLIFDNHKFTKSEIEQFKESDLLASVLKKMSTEFPELGRVFVKERDIYLAFSLQNAVSCSFYNHQNECEPTVAVGVVGIGHTPGIKELWMKVSDEDVQPILVPGNLNPTLLTQRVKNLFIVISFLLFLHLTESHVCFPDEQYQGQHLPLDFQSTFNMIRKHGSPFFRPLSARLSFYFFSVEERKGKGYFKKTLGICICLYIGYRMRHRIGPAVNQMIKWFK